MPRPISHPHQPPDQHRSLLLLEDAEVTMVTFGGKEVYWEDKGHSIPFDILIARNTDYVVVQCGLNFRILPNRKVYLAGDHDYPSELEKKQMGGIWVNEQQVKVPDNARIIVTNQAMFAASHVTVGVQTLKDRFEPTTESS